MNFDHHLCEPHFSQALHRRLAGLCTHCTVYTNVRECLYLLLQRECSKIESVTECFTPIAGHFTICVVELMATDIKGLAL
jgi:hypothetical protein